MKNMNSTPTKNKPSKNYSGYLGEKFLVSEHYSRHTRPSGEAYYKWKCICNCGNTFLIDAGDIKKGVIKSCGCKNKERFLTDKGIVYKSNFLEFEAYRGMIRRCTNPSIKGYPEYGGRGIKVCEEWLSSFESFYKDMGKRPTDSSLDRIDNNGNYCKENCRWASRDLQSFNTRKQKNNTSGRTGVDLLKNGKFRARICINSRWVGLGYFDRFDDAVAAREKAEVAKYGFTKE